jgi:hypothetical protein
MTLGEFRTELRREMALLGSAVEELRQAQRTLTERLTNQLIDMSRAVIASAALTKSTLPETAHNVAMTMVPPVMPPTGNYDTAMDLDLLAPSDPEEPSDWLGSPPGTPFGEPKQGK